MPLAAAAHVVQKAVVDMLGGKMPSESMPAAFHHLRMAFPILRPRDVKKLLRAGCPRGRITALVLQVEMENRNKPPLVLSGGEVHGRKRLTVLVELDQDQADFHADATREIMERDECTKDDAWLWVNNLIGQLLAGAILKETEGTHEILLLRAAGLFQGLTEKEALAMPLATEDDVRRWSFTEDPAR